MSLWSGITKVAKGANKVRNGVGKAKGVANQVKEDGVGKTAAKMLSAKVRKKFLKMMLHALKSFFGFLLTPPFGWLTAFGIVCLLVMLGHSTLGSDTALDNTNNNSSGDNVTQQQYAALQKSCNTGGSHIIDASVSTSGDGMSKKWGYNDVSKFASFSIKSTFKISNDKAAALFLSQDSVRATHFGLNKSNIDEVTQAVLKEGVSPVFFYLYAIEELNGDGGFINHYTSDTPGGAVANAKRDAQYIVQEANLTTDHPATGGGEPSDMDTGPATELYKKLPKGSIGKVYLPATSAATAEIANLKGGHWNDYGPPFQHAMNRIVMMGGDPFAGDQISDTDASDDGDCSTPTQTLGGGMTYDQAQKFMTAFNKTDLKSSDYPKAAPGSPDVHDNCTVFVAWFINKYTKLTMGGGNGGEIVDNLIKANSELKKSDSPEVYSVFSIQGNHGSDLTAGDAGHTGIILGIDKSAGKAIIGEAMYGHKFTSVTNVDSGVNTIEYPLSKMNAKQGWSFIPLKDKMKTSPSA